jgi:hypothetical protein
VTIEEFVCLRDMPGGVALGRKIAITLPNGQTFIFCLPGRPG